MYRNSISLGVVSKKNVGQNYKTCCAYFCLFHFVHILFFSIINFQKTKNFFFYLKIKPIWEYSSFILNLFLKIFKVWVFKNLLIEKNKHVSKTKLTKICATFIASWNVGYKKHFQKANAQNSHIVYIPPGLSSQSHTYESNRSLPPTPQISNYPFCFHFEHSPEQHRVPALNHRPASQPEHPEAGAEPTCSPDAQRGPMQPTHRAHPHREPALRAAANPWPPAPAHQPQRGPQPPHHHTRRDLRLREPRLALLPRQPNHGTPRQHGTSAATQGKQTYL